MAGRVEELERYAWSGRGGQPNGVEKVKAKEHLCVVPRGEAALARDLASRHGAFKVGLKFKGGAVSYRDRKGNKLKSHEPMLQYLLEGK